LSGLKRFPAREVFRAAISDGAQSIVLAHNHPSGDPSPSSEDLAITRQLIGAGQIVGIRVLDHVIIGRTIGSEADNFISFREAGLADFAD
jgi:DNA repair protein RadC